MQIEENIFQTIKLIFNTIAEKDIDLTKESLRKEIYEWDSIFHLNLIVELEEKFDVSFSIEEIEDLDSLNKIIFKILKNNIV